jgi:hypothetical protein
LFWQLRAEPLLTALSKPHMKLLHLSARSIFLHMQIQTKQGGHNCDWLGTLIGMLSRVRINNILVDKPRISMRQRVVQEFVIEVLIG